MLLSKMARIQTRGNWYFKNGFKNAKFYEPWLVNLLYNLTSKALPSPSLCLRVGMGAFSGAALNNGCPEHITEWRANRLGGAPAARAPGPTAAPPFDHRDRLEDPEEGYGGPFCFVSLLLSLLISTHPIPYLCLC